MIIYTVGYSGRTPAELATLVDQLGAVLVDIRYSPRSRDPRWAKSNVQKLVGAYLHLRSLGNVNYRVPGAPAQLADLAAGAEVLRPILEQQPVILMCACRDVHSCHRREAAEWLASRLDCEVRHL